MKYTLTFIAILISQLCIAQQITYKEWKEQAKTEIRLLPEYGNVIKTKGQIAADQELIQTEVQQEGTYRKASDHLITLGFNNLYVGDVKTAMYRFNQAWLLDPKNANVYWGYGAIYLSFNDTDEALRQYDKGLAIDPKSANILTDKATAYMSIFANMGRPDYLNKAIELFNKSYNIDPSNQNTSFKLSAAYFYKKDCVNARKFYNACMKLGGQPITQEYTDALNKMCAK
ncbi:MAG TPA: tetratricopeptide repeat protein [Mucilaginibacter sp.]|jgi:tetratricopeptide (TPR) repeat protein|nr:tetratricopeptide repeat protein [Mucilaginibacter sp.]